MNVDANCYQAGIICQAEAFQSGEGEPSPFPC